MYDNGFLSKKVERWVKTRERLWRIFKSFHSSFLKGKMAQMKGHSSSDLERMYSANLQEAKGSLYRLSVVQVIDLICPLRVQLTLPPASVNTRVY